MSNTVYNKVTFKGDTLIDLSQDTVTSAAHILSGHTGHLADGTQVAGTATSSLIVTFSYNETTEQWEPNITFAEIQAAYTAGEEIGMNTSNVDINGHCSFDPYENRFYYDIVEYNYSTNKLNYLYYYYYDNGVHPDASTSYIS